jgi:uncharacterized alkaline shock family protein YloU
MNYTDGKTTIAPEVLLTIARLTASSVEGVSRLHPVPSANLQRLIKRGHATEGVTVEIIDDVVYTDLYLVLHKDYNVRDVSRSVQKEVSRAISDQVGMVVGRVNVHIEDIDYPQEAEA